MKKDKNGEGEILSLALLKYGYLKTKQSKSKKTKEIEDTKEQHNMAIRALFCDKEIREQIFKHFDDLYEETKEEKEILHIMTRRRRG